MSIKRCGFIESLNQSCSSIGGASTKICEEISLGKMKLSCGSSVMCKLVALSVLVLILACSGTEGVKEKKSSGKSLERIDTVEEADLTVTNSTSLLARLRKFISPRLIDELTGTFGHYGLHGTIAAGAVFIIIIPLYLAAALVGWVPLKNILNPVRDDMDYSSYYKPSITYYQAGTSTSTKYGHPSLPSPAPMYGYSEAPEMTIHYGYPEAPAPSPAPQYGYPAAPTPAPAPVYGYSPAPVPTPAPQYGYPPAPAPAPAPQYGYPPAPAPNPAPQYGYPAPSPSYGHMSPTTSSSYGQPSSDPTPGTNYGYSAPDPVPVYGYSAIVSAPAPASQYGSPKSSSYGAPEIEKTVKAEVKMTARKARSIRLHDAQCAERLACEISKATGGIKLPRWMDKVADILPWKANEVVEGARQLLTEASDCSKFICDSYEMWGRLQ